MSGLKLSIKAESWLLAKPFTISRGTKTAADVVVVTLTDANGVIAHAECVPYPRYDESVGGVMAEIEQHRAALEAGLTRDDLQSVMPAGAARNAVDCALWDLEAKQSGKRAWDIAGSPEPQPTITAETISIGTPEDMFEAASVLASAPLIKVKLNREMPVTRMAAVREAAANARLIIDPNESWDIELLNEVAKPLADLGVEMIEQPLPSDKDSVLENFDSPVPLCADESCHTVETLPLLKARYDMINVKLDKTGGLTEALKITRAAHGLNFEIMIGCMVGTSLAMAPATVLAPYAKFVDLDGPLLMKEDRNHGLDFTDGKVSPPTRQLWG